MEGRVSMRFNRKSVVVTVNTDDPVISTADMKDFLRVSGSDDDAKIAAYVTAATEATKQYLRIGLQTQTMVLRADGFTGAGDDALVRLGPGHHTVSVPFIIGGSGTLELPFPPVASVTSVVTYDRADNASTFSASRYGVDLQGARIYLNEGETWPVDLRAYNSVQVTYVAGYGAANVPAPIVEAIRRYVEQLFDGCDGMTDEVKRLLGPYRRMDEMAFS